MSDTTLDWEGVTWTMTGRRTSRVESIHCDGCDNFVSDVATFSAVDPLGATLMAKWCVECVEHCKGEMAFAKARKELGL